MAKNDTINISSIIKSKIIFNNNDLFKASAIIEYRFRLPLL
jgi:hypothetical protein